MVQNNSEDAVPNPRKDVHEDLVLSLEDLAQGDIKLTNKQLRSKENSIAKTLWNAGYKISQTIIREFILDLHPNAADWLTSDARLEVISAVKKRYPRQDKKTKK